MQGNLPVQFLGGGEPAMALRYPTYREVKMAFAEFVDALLDNAPVVGIALGIVIVVAIPPLRRSVVQSFMAGKKAAEEAREQRKKKKEDIQGGADS
jgi:hypothetical protein